MRIKYILLFASSLSFLIGDSTPVFSASRPGNANPSSAMAHGYYMIESGTDIMNDFSSRKIQLDEMKLNLGPAKGKDFGTALGPYITTRDQISNRVIPTENGNKYDIPLTAYLNGNLLSSDNLKNMNWTFAQIIERISCGTHIYPGDVIGSGTCATGCLYELNSYPDAEERWLQHNDSIKIKAGVLGVLKNTIKVI